jgi:TRAP transporter TAXI family solute receptor
MFGLKSGPWRPKLSLKNIVYAALLCGLFVGPAMAQQGPQSLIVQANQGTVGVITGMEGGTYAKTAADLMILDNGTLRVLPVLGKGSLQNLSDILYLKGIDIGFVQADALTYAKQHNMFPNLAQGIQYISKLYDEEVHVLARKDITQLQDLNNRRVNVDVVGSGSAMTAEIVLNALGIHAKLEHQPQVIGVQELEQGQIAAIIHVGGAPIPLLKDVPGGSGLHFLQIPINQTLLATYLPGELSHADYPSLVAADQKIPTLAVADVMAVYAWAPYTERYKRVSRFVDAFFTRFSELQKPPHHPKWREVNLAAQVPGWTRFQPATDWLQQHTIAGTAGGETQARFNQFLARANPVSYSDMTEPAKEALFRQFLLWEQRPASR